MNDKNATKGKNIVPAYCTYALADKEKIDKKTKATSPSESNVEDTREWSIENKL